MRCIDDMVWTGALTTIYRTGFPHQLLLLVVNRPKVIPVIFYIFSVRT